MTQGKDQINLLTIQQFAQVCRTTPRTLRFYEQKRLFKPVKIDAWNKYRFYDSKQARDFLKIKLLQNFYIPLEQIKKHTLNNAENFLESRLKSVQEEIKEKEKEYKFLREMKDFLFDQDCHSELVSESKEMLKRVQHDIKRITQSIFQPKTFGPYNLFCMKVEHGEYAGITEYIKKLWKEAKRLKLKCQPSEITFYLDNRYNPKNTPLEISLILRARIRQLAETSREVQINKFSTSSNSNNFYFKSYPKTKILAYKYIGPYEYLILVYQKLFSIIDDQKINLKGLVFETYKYGPLNTKSKYDYETTIGFPI